MLKDFFGQARKQHKYKDYGVSITKHHNPYSESRDESDISGALEKYEPFNEVAEELGKEYCLRLKDYEFADNDYFDEDDEPFNMIHEFYTGDFATQDYDCNLLDLERYFNITRRGCLNRPRKGEKLAAYTASYTTGMRIGHIDSIKIMAWAVTHAFLTGYLIDTDYLFQALPYVASDEIKEKWDECVAAQDDIPDSVKEIFTMANLSEEDNDEAEDDYYDEADE